MSPRLYPLLAMITVGAAACSILNREGPDVTCVDLDGGTKNACSEGIVASCVGGEVSWQVCDVEGACEEAWQAPEQYRCDETDPFPTGTATGAGGGSPTSGVGGVGGAGAVGPSGSTGTSGSGGCDPSGPCEVAGNDLPIEAYAVDAGQLYFADRETLRSVPVAGGVPTVLASGLRGVGLGRIAVDGSHVYVHEGIAPDAIVRVPTEGGTPETIATSEAMGPFCVDEENVYWVEEYDPRNLMAAPKGGGASVIVAESIQADWKRLICRDGFVYWQNGEVLRVSTRGEFPTSPVSIPLGNSPEDFAVGPDAIFFVTSGDVNPGGPGNGVVGKVPFTGGVSELVTAQTHPGRVTFDNGSVYWSGLAGAGYLRRVRDDGGGLEDIAMGDGETPEPGMIVVDETHVYWARGSSMWRAPKGN